MSSYSSTRSIAIIDAWLDDIQSFILEPNSPLPICKKRARSPTPLSSSHRKRIALAAGQGNVMKRANREVNDIDTPKRQQIFIDQDDTPRAAPLPHYTSNLMSQDIPEPTNRSVTPSTESATRSSVSNQSGRTGSVKGLGSLMMTETPVNRSDKFSDIPSSGQNLYKDLLRCKAGHQVLPNAIKASLAESFKVPLVANRDRNTL